MATGVVYPVVLSLSTTGSLSTKLTDIGGRAQATQNHVTSIGHAASGVGEKISSLGERLGGFLESVTDKALGIVEAFARVGVAAGLAAATYGVMGLNKELETTQISLGAIATAQGFAGSFNKGFELAGEQLRKMKTDVKTLPGDLGQLSQIMTMIATPAAQAGASFDEIRKLAGKTMLTGTILGVPLEVAQREMAGLLSGRAGAHNIFGARLGLIGAEAERFNKLAPSERLSRLNAEIEKYSGAADRFGQSFVANFTTLKDNLKYSVLAEATAPLFERVKQTMASINTWFDQNTDKVKQFADVVGKDLVKAWDAVTSRVQALLPTVSHLVDRFERMGSGDFKALLGGAGLGVIGLKLLPSAVAGAGGMVGDVAGMAAKFLPMLMGGGGGLAGLAGGAGGLGAVTTALGALLNPVTLGVGAAALGTLALVFTSVVGAVDALSSETSEFHGKAVALWGSIQISAGEAFTSITHAAGNLWDAVRPLVDALGVELLNVIAEIAYTTAEWAKKIDAASAAIKRNPIWNAMFPAVQGGGGPGEPVPTLDNYDPGPIVGGFAMAAAEAASKTMAKVGGGGGGGGTHVQKVEIVVNSNQDPTRIAHAVAGEFAKWQRNPKRSPLVPAYDNASPLVGRPTIPLPSK